MALPWLIGGAVLATVAYLTKDDDSSSYSDKEERKQKAKKRAKKQAKKREREERNIKTLLEIDSYKKKEIIYIKEKYNHTVYIKNTENFSREIHEILKHASKDILKILKSKLGNSFISLKGTVKENILEGHIEKLKYTFQMKVLQELSFIENIENFDNKDIQNILRISINETFKKNIEDMEFLDEFFQENNKLNIFNRLKIIYKVEKIYQNLIKTYENFHNLLSDDEILKNIEQFILNDIEVYAGNFSDKNIEIISGQSH